MNPFVTFEERPSTFRTTREPSGCPAGFMGTFSFEARLTNVSFSLKSVLSDLVVKVTELTNGNLLLFTEGGPNGVGALLVVPPHDDFADELLSPGEFVTVFFVICLREIAPFTLQVDVLGTVR
jgi:hypothetical protein